MVNFTDITNHWAKNSIETLANKGMISGYRDGTFKPDAPLTRAEFATMLIKAFPQLLDSREPLQFKDVPSNFWAYSVIQKTYSTGFMSGYEDQSFKPQQNIPRVQALVSLVKGLNYEPSQSIIKTLNQSLNDGKDIPNYAKNAIAAAIEFGLVVNYPEVKLLNPNKPATRAEVAVFFCQALRQVDEPLTIAEQYIVKPPIIPVPTGELRGVWLTNIDSDVLFSKNTLTNALNLLAECNFNTVYPTIWNNGYTLYPSVLMERFTGTQMYPIPELKDRDILKEMIPLAKEKKISVIPWFEYGFMVPPDSKIVELRPHWITCRQDGTKVYKESQVNQVWLNPFHPQVQQFLLGLIIEVVKNYEVDGIQFDDHFGLPVDLGYDEFTIQLYRKETGNSQPPTDFQEANWVSWRAKKITEFVSRVFWVIKDYKPNCILSLSPNPYLYAYSQFLQDWKTWEQEGYLEELVLQLYRDDINGFLADLKRPELLEAKSHIPVSIGILTGLRIKPISFLTVKEQIQLTRDRQFAGTTFFFYETWKQMMESETQKNEFKTLFSQILERPQFV
ncbi:conserved hypothetical protein [Planktothrix sp. PCC 11201]|uniref:glycoside hydrolase family 10 protein n=1 Tax=Planktothrix sp. PCC 11201 TaxID=1729650 RepID=UPI00091887D8|nr:family 10 glycosylhydrolase [Planktothrix sp. PCC 11201]SKB12857.1 conserved hypothetical protein [Planktothrix sp. PCC 11201]